MLCIHFFKFASRYLTPFFIFDWQYFIYKIIFMRLKIVLILFLVNSKWMHLLTNIFISVKNISAQFSWLALNDICCISNIILILQIFFWFVKDFLTFILMNERRHKYEQIFEPFFDCVNKPFLGRGYWRFLKQRKRYY